MGTNANKPGAGRQTATIAPDSRARYPDAPASYPRWRGSGVMPSAEARSIW